MSEEHVTRSVTGVAVRLSLERWAHITARHPELRGLHRAVLGAVKEPDRVVTGRRGELIAVKRVRDLGQAADHLVVVYRELSGRDGFIITAQVISRPRALLRRPTVWPGRF